MPPNGTYDPDLSTNPPSEVITRFSGPEFFDELAALLNRTPLNPPDDRTSALLAELGVHPHDQDRLPDPEVLGLAKAEGLELIKHHRGPTPVNGWTFFTTGIGTYGTDYLQRAYVATIGLGANSPRTPSTPRRAPRPATTPARRSPTPSPSPRANCRPWQPSDR
ncbi:hypothetical protein [Streptomyces rubellomurinus]|uniref:Uncharacterized protein n=1 Tax=Streptomyces rubellomurinus (strain ATCC 31215) TaxID=359131 RepID=A0A0F2TLY5_STRR3|nr:hypothetical protein [Streptomyces rubellomurinus]KJS62747.1 hypothetical protein VM95_07175 [Streptomyces rubellomurinus]